MIGNLCESVLILESYVSFGFQLPAEPYKNGLWPLVGAIIA